MDVLAELCAKAQEEMRAHAREKYPDSNEEWIETVVSTLWNQTAHQVDSHAQGADKLVLTGRDDTDTIIIGNFRIGYVQLITCQTGITAATANAIADEMMSS